MTRAVYDPRQWLPVDAPLTNSPGNRSPELLRAVAAQFDVTRNDRFKVQVVTNPVTKKRTVLTWCNIFLADVLLALKTGPWLHWIETKRKLYDGTVDESHAGDPTPLPDKSAAYEPSAPRVITVELDANDMVAWFTLHGSRFGWTATDRDLAGAAAARGMPVAVVWGNVTPGPLTTCPLSMDRKAGPGHVALLLPPVGAQLRIVQAGGQNLFDSALEAGFGRLPVKFYQHA